MTTQMDIADRIKRLRTRIGVSRKEFAEILGVSKMSTWRWESGDVKPMPAHLRQIEALEIKYKGKKKP